MRRGIQWGNTIGGELGPLSKEFLSWCEIPFCLNYAWGQSQTLSSPLVRKRAASLERYEEKRWPSNFEHQRLQFWRVLTNEINKLVRKNFIEVFSVLETIRLRRIEEVKQAFEAEWDSHNNNNPNSPESMVTIWVFWRMETWTADNLLTHPQLIHLKLRKIGGLRD